MGERGVLKVKILCPRAFSSSCKSQSPLHVSFVIHCSVTTATLASHSSRSAKTVQCFVVCVPRSSSQWWLHVIDAGLFCTDGQGFAPRPSSATVISHLIRSCTTLTSPFAISLHIILTSRHRAWADMLPLSREASSRSLQSLSDANDDAAARRRRLMEGIWFTQRFIITYKWVLIGVVVLFSIRHWYGRLAAFRRQRASKRGYVRTGVLSHATGVSGSSSSSSSSTIGVPPSATPPLKFEGEGERAPLLPFSDAPLSTSATRLHLAARRLQAIGMYQPRPIPLVKKVLPSNSATLIVLLLIALNAFYALYNTVWTAEMAFVFPDRTALLFVANLPWLYLLAAKNQPIKFLTGYSYEGLNLLHRRLGELLCFLAIVHAAGMLIAWYVFFRPGGMTVFQFLALPIILFGLGALACYELLYLTSLGSFREWWYELFLGTHVALQAGALIFVFLHHHGGRVYIGITLAIFLVDRVVFRILLKSRSVHANLTVMEDDNTVLVSADWPVQSKWGGIITSVFGLNVRYGWKSTEHIFLTIPAIARKHVIQAHPFTIASAAPTGDHAWFNLIVRAHDGFTRDLLHHARNHKTAMIRLDGPYGSMHALEMLQDSDVSLIVAGGSGIAVAYPLLWSLLCSDDTDTEAARHRKKVGLIWVIHEASHVDWIGHERLDELKTRSLRLCITPPTSKAGRPDVSALTGTMINDMIMEIDAEAPRVAVVVSGPDGMNRSVRNTCAELVWHGVDAHVAVEKYGW